MSTATETKSNQNGSVGQHSDQPNKPKSRVSWCNLVPQLEVIKPVGSGWKTTWCYVGVATLCLAVTGALEWANRPAAIKEYGKVGQQFYDDFVDPTLATSLEVFTFDAETVQPKNFKVEKLANGRWVIPSHHNYPAEAEQRLADTASSIIGIERGAMVTRWEADHGRYGVVNPKQDTLSVDQVDGVGQRLTLRGDDDAVLADYIVGKQVDGSYGEYYVRHPAEDEVYIASLDVDLSTRFSDWIKPELFDLSAGSILKLTVNDYSFDELNGTVTEREVSEVSREKAFGNDWTLASLDADTEELNSDAVRDTTNAIADLEILGVRPKEKGLTPELTLDKSALGSQRDVEFLQSDLLTRGFLLQPGESKDQLNLISREGELYAGTDDGLVYRMHFGRAFAGSQGELEVGFANDESDSEQGGAESAAVKASDTDVLSSSSAAEGVVDTQLASTEEASGDDASEESSKPGRYLFVRVDFDESLLGEPLYEPTEPEKPAELVEAEEAAVDTEDETEAEKGSESESESATSGNVDDTSVNAETEGNDDENEAADEADAKSAEEDRLKQLREDYDVAKKQYDDDLKAFNDRQEEIIKGQEKAEELNRRFADWYYVISGDSFDKLSLARADLVNVKESTEESNDEADAEEEPLDEVTVTEESDEAEASNAVEEAGDETAATTEN